MSIVRRSGKVVLTGGQAVTNAACCCDIPPCSEAFDGFSFIDISGGVAAPGEGTPCLPCELPDLPTGITGSVFWDFYCEADNGWTYDIYALPGFPSSCQNCNDSEFDPTGYAPIGSLGGAVDYLRIARVLDTGCNETNYRCFWVVATHTATGTECSLCPEGSPDTSGCANCCVIVITSTPTDCFPFSDTGAGVQSVSASFTITIPVTGLSPDCPELMEEPIEWTLYIGGIAVATGIGTTGSGSGDASCACPDENPCPAPSPDIAVTWSSGPIVCGG